MKRFTFALILLHFTSFAQPGPPIPFSEVLQPINEEIELDPNNDEARLRRIQLYLYGGNFSYDILLNATSLDSSLHDSIREKHELQVSRPISDIRYLENRWKAGENQELLTSELIHGLYGTAYENSNPELSKTHFIKATKFKQEQRFYEGIFNAYRKLDQIDSALLYHDSLNLLFNKNSVRKPRIDFYFHDKIELLKRKNEFTQELVDYYNWLSTEYFTAYEEDCRKAKEGDYISKHYLELGLNFQYDLCEYYFKHNRFKQVELLVHHLDRFVPRNKYGVVLNMYPYHRYFKIAGDLAMHNGQNEKAIRLYLIAANHMSFHKDIQWSAKLLEANKDNPDAYVLHGLVSVNHSRQGYWHETPIQENTMNFFDTAQMMGSNYYVIHMMHYFNLVAKKEFINAEKRLNETIAENPHIPMLYDEKYQLNRKMYWSNLITEEELEKRLKIITEQVEKLRVPERQPSLSTLKR